jgi:hypothetical protein
MARRLECLLRLIGARKEETQQYYDRKEDPRDRVNVKSASNSARRLKNDTSARTADQIPPTIERTLQLPITFPFLIHKNMSALYNSCSGACLQRSTDQLRICISAE